MVGTKPTVTPSRRAAARCPASSSRVSARRGVAVIRACWRRPGRGCGAGRDGAGRQRCVDQRGVEDAAELGGPDGQQSPVGHDPVEGGPRQGDVRRQGVRRRRPELGDVTPHGLDVTAHDRTGEGGVALAQRVVEGGGQQGTQRAGRVVGTRGVQELHRLGDEGDQVVGAVGERGVVERCASPPTPTWRCPPRSATSPSVKARSASPAVTPNTQPGSRVRSTAVPVKVIAGCTRHGHGADSGRGIEHGQAVPSGGVHDVLPLVDGAAGRQHGDDVGQHVVGNGEQQHVAGARHGGRLLGRVRRAAGRRSGGGRRRTHRRPRRSRGRPRRSAAARTAPTRPAPITPMRCLRADAGVLLLMVEPFVPVPPTPCNEGRCGYRTCARSDQRRIYAARFLGEPLPRVTWATRAATRATRRRCGSLRSPGVACSVLTRVSDAAQGGCHGVGSR